MSQDKLQSYRKTCTRCGQEKHAAEFSKLSESKDGLRPGCRACALKYNSAYNVAYRQNNKDRSSAYMAEYRKNNPGIVAAYASKYRKNNPAVSNAKTARRRASKLQATPSWAIKFYIDEAYLLAKRRQDVCGGEWQVDHIVPLNSDIVCGLHVQGNLQVIPAVMNARKGNKYWPDMPEAST